jgi:hypothetical protein
VSGPAFATVLAFIDLTVAGYTIDKDTAPALFMVLVALLMALFTAVLFKPQAQGEQQHEGGGTDPGGSSSSEKVALISAHTADEEESMVDGPTEVEIAPPSTAGIAVCLITFFIHFYSFVR